MMKYLPKIPRIMNSPNLQTRFLLRVLFPPFLILVIISVAGYLLLSAVVRTSAVDNLQRIGATTAAKLEREFALRKNVLRSTGSELFSLQSDYNDKRTKLDNDYKACRSFVKTNSHFVSAPGDVCQPFYAQFAVALQNGTALTQAVDNGYTESANELSTLELTSVNQQFSSFVKIFPETSTLLVADKNGRIVSQSANGGHDSDSFIQSLKATAKRALKESVEATYATDGDVRQVVFAYPIDQGAVLASYDLDNGDFMYPSWKSAPIDNTKAYLVIADAISKTSYPNVKDKSLYTPALGKSQTDFNSSNVEYLATAEPVSGTNWHVIVSSPAAIALEPLANTQILAVAVAGVLLVSFMWVGSIFVRRTVDSILGLVGGAIIFSSGQLTHRIDASRMSDKEFSQLAEIMNNMAVKIQEAEAAIDQKNKEFISVATHEIKAPMTAIIGNLSMLLDDGMGAMDSAAHDLADQAYQGTIRLRELVNELLDIARLESGRAKFNLEPIDLAKEIEAMVKLQWTPATEKNISLKYAAESQPLMVVADKTKLEIVLTNFISNGIKYNRSPGEVYVTHTQSAGTVTISIQDTGLGIPKDQQEKMFQKFFRVEGEDRAGIPGTGLGMYITKQFIEGMGGKLWFESQYGKGTVFHFTLPLATDSTAQKNPDTDQGK
jgi:signal transduction histidine kinase